MTITFGSLFAGIGGFDLGFERVGMRCLWQVENDLYCNYVLGLHFKAERFGDITKIIEGQLQKVDVICFGSPCQGFTVIGDRKGLEDERSELFNSAIQVVQQLRPSIAVWENVPGVLSSNNGRDFAYALHSFQQCGEADIAWRIINSASFRVPTSRRRMFLVADYRAERSSKILFEQKIHSWDEIPRVQYVFPFPSVNYRVYDPLGISPTFRALAGGGGAKNGLYVVDQAADPNGNDTGDGVPHRLVGNAVVPQVSEWLGKRIIQYWSS